MTNNGNKLTNQLITPYKTKLLIGLTKQINQNQPTLGLFSRYTHWTYVLIMNLL